MLRRLQQGQSYLCVPSPMSPSPHTRLPPTMTEPIPRMSYKPDDQMSVCSQPRNKLCTCQKAAAEKQAGIRRTFPRTQSGNMRLPDRDLAGHPIEKGPRVSEEIVGTGRREYLMSLQEPRASVDSREREGMDVVTLVGPPGEGTEAGGLLQIVEVQEVRDENNEDRDDIRRVSVDGEKQDKPMATRKVPMREYCKKKLGKMVKKTCFATDR